MDTTTNKAQVRLSQRSPGYVRVTFDNPCARDPHRLVRQMGDREHEAPREHELAPGR
jgi:NaMN:DMB phosphoribosyltransferase